MSDLISRQAAIDAADRADYTGLAVEDVKKVTDEVVKELKRLPSALPEPSIPISWIKKKIDWLASLDNAFASLAASNLSVMVKQYEEGCEFDADTEG